MENNITTVSSYKLLNYKFDDYVVKCSDGELFDIIKLNLSRKINIGWNEHPTLTYVRLLCEKLKDTDKYRRAIRSFNMMQKLCNNENMHENTDRLTLLRSVQVPSEFDINEITTDEGRIEFVACTLFTTDIIEIMDDEDTEPNMIDLCNRAMATIYETFLTIADVRNLDDMCAEYIDKYLMNFDFDTPLSHIYSVYFIKECLRDDDLLWLLKDAVGIYGEISSSLINVPKRDAFKAVPEVKF